MANRCLSVMLVLVGISMVYVGFTGISVTWVTTWPVVLVGAGILLIGVAVARCMVTFRVVDECECHAQQAVLELNPSWVHVVFIGSFILAMGMSGGSALLDPRVIERANQVVARGSGDPSSWPPLDPTTIPQLRIREVIARSGVPEDLRLRGQKFMVKGQVSTRDDMRVLSRVVIICCAADARMYQVRLHDPKGILARVSDGMWVMVAAEFMPGTGTERNQWVPSIAVTGAEIIGDAGYERFTS